MKIIKNLFTLGLMLLATTSVSGMHNELSNYSVKKIPISDMLTKNLIWPNNNIINLEAFSGSIHSINTITGKIKTKTQKTTDHGNIYALSTINSFTSTKSEKFKAEANFQGFSVSNIKNKKCIKEFKFFDAFNGSIETAAFSPSENLLLVVLTCHSYTVLESDNPQKKQTKTLKIFNTHTWKEILLPQNITISDVYTLAFHPQEPIIALGLKNNTMLFLNTNTWNVILRIQNNTPKKTQYKKTILAKVEETIGNPQQMEWSPDGSKLAISSTSQELIVINFPSLMNTTKKNILEKIKKNNFTDLIIKLN